MISVIISCFNGEKYLNRLLTSLLEQTDNRFETIIVNDGSTDNSAKIISQYSERLNIKYVEIKNSGVSRARNEGLKYVSGEYIYFIDCDDWIDNNTIAFFNKLIVNQLQDLYIFNYYKDNVIIDDKNIKEGKFTRGNTLELLISSVSFKGYLWNKLFKTSVIKNNLLQFDESIRFSEDLLFTVNFLKWTDEVAYIKEAFYHYSINDTSITKKYYSKSKITGLKAIEKSIDSLIDIGNKYHRKLYITFYYNFLISLLMYGYKESSKKQVKLSLYENLYKYPAKMIISNKIKVSVLLARISTNSLYNFWKIFGGKFK